MNGDFSRDTFKASKHFLRVLLQQGRVQLDADWNEQGAILLHYLQNLAADLIGSHGGPAGENFGFGITWGAENKDLNIDFGHYYVDGVLCENDVRKDLNGNVIPLTYFTQPDYPLKAGSDNFPGFPFLVYLDVWERHITIIEDPEIREQALPQHLDTAYRAKVLWQVKITDGKDAGVQIKKENVLKSEEWKKLTEKWQPSNRGQLKAQAMQTTSDESPCIISPKARFRGAENQLYRVEIHSSGYAKFTGKPEQATFKWSRDNGAVVYPIKAMNFATENSIATTIVTVDHFGRDIRFSPVEGDWVEILDDDYVLQVGPGSGRPVEKLLKIIRVDQVNRQIVLEGRPQLTVGTNPIKYPFLRRWDHREGDAKDAALQLGGDGAFSIEEDKWHDLEDGVQVLFKSVPSGGGKVEPHHYRHGDYWLIPARTATGDVDWPTQEVKENNQTEVIPIALPPHGIEHHFAPLAVINSKDSTGIENCRRKFSLNLEIPVTASLASSAETVSAAEATPRPSAKKAGTKTKDAQ